MFGVDQISKLKFNINDTLSGGKEFDVRVGGVNIITWFLGRWSSLLMGRVGSITWTGQRNIPYMRLEE